MTEALVFAAGVALGWLCLRDRTAYWRTECLAAEAELRAGQRDTRRPLRDHTWRTQWGYPERVTEAVAPSGIDLARVVCPAMWEPAEDRWLIRRRVHEEAIA